MSSLANEELSGTNTKALRTHGRGELGDAIFRSLTMAFAGISVLLIVWIGLQMYHSSALSWARFGIHFLASTAWNAPQHDYGALTFIYGTIVSSALALLIAVPIGIGAAIFLAEIAPGWISAPFSFLIELLAAVPSVIFGLWGFMVLCPWLNGPVADWIIAHFGSIPIFAGPAYLTNMLAAGVVLGLMVLPFVTAVSRDVIRAVPRSQGEAAYGLGATRWETIHSVVLRYGRSGIVGAIILGLGRAVGETMAVAMVVGNNTNISTSLFAPGYTMPSLLANQFNEAFDRPLQRSALLEIALILFIITLVVNILARLLLWMVSRNMNETGLSAGYHVSRFQRISSLADDLVRQACLPLLACGYVFWLFLGFQRSGINSLTNPIIWIVPVIAGWIGWQNLLRSTRLWGRWRRIKNILTLAICAFLTFVSVAVLLIIFGYVVIQGAHAITPTFFTQAQKSPDDPTGGVLNGILGTVVLVIIASVIGLPIGILGGIYLAEYGRGRIKAFVRFAADVLNGIPSVVIGTFVYAIMVLPMKRFSALSGGVALAIMLIPTVMRTTEELLKLVPDSLREGSLGLGASQSRTVIRVVLPAARAGIITGIMLAIARIAGETAPLLFTAFGNDVASTKLLHPISSMTMLIYHYSMSPYNIWITQAWGSALVLLLMVFLVSLAARLVTRNQIRMV